MTEQWFKRILNNYQDYRRDGLDAIPEAVRELLGNKENSIETVVDRLPTWEDPGSYNDWGVYIVFMFVPVRPGKTLSFLDRIITIDGRQYDLG